jgi:PAS domain-containing protein
MEWISAGCRDVIGYDPHRFIGNASMAFGDLLERSDWNRVNERVRLAAQHRQRATVEYRIRTAHGAWTKVEDRLTPIVDDDGRIIAIEGIIDRSRHHDGTSWTPPPALDDAHFAGPFTSHSSN